jgi:hypothetical protein
MDGRIRLREQPFALRLEPSKSQRLRPPRERKSINCGSEVDLMTALYPLNVHRRIERQWAERIKSLRQIHGQIIVATERTLEHVFNNDGSLIPVPVRAVVDGRQLDQPRLHD